MIKVGIYPEDIILDLYRDEQTLDGETTSSGSYSEMCSTNSEGNTLDLSHRA